MAEEKNDTCVGFRWKIPAYPCANFPVFTDKLTRAVRYE
jgi:hypothetical protein